MRWIRTKSRGGPSAATLGLVAPLAVALLGCNGPLHAPLPKGDASEAAPQRGGTLRLASIGDIRGLDPAVTADALAAAAMELLYAGLVDYGPAGEIVPDLASHFEISPDGLTYRFTLREGTRFHDGEELTADDVKRSIERSLHPSTPNPFSSAYEMIAGYTEYTEKKADELAGVVVEGRYVVAIHLRERDAKFLAVMALQFLRPVCKSAGNRYVDSWAPCGAGPFKLAPGAWERGRSLTLVRHDAYFRPGLPYLDAVTWTYSMNLVTERFKFEDGDLDLLREFSQADATRFLHDARWKPTVAYEADRNVFGESLNTEMPPFDNVEVRRAVAAAIDREHYRLLRPSSIVPASQVIPPAVPGYDPSFVGQKYDYEAALEHMRKAGYPYDPATGKGGYPKVIEYNAFKQGFTEFSAQVLQQDLAKIGLRIEIKITSYPTFLALAYRRHKSAMSMPGWTQDYPDPSDFFEPLFSAKAINDEDSTNTAFYANPRLDEILDRARGELDKERRYALYGEANRIVCDDAPWAFTHTYRYLVGWQPYVHGYRPHPVWSDYVATAWLDRTDAKMARGHGPAWTAQLASLFAPAAIGGAR